MSWARWDDLEINLLRESWARGGFSEATKVLPNRSRFSIANAAARFNFRVKGKKSYQKWPKSQFVDAAIRRAYQAAGTPNLAALAKATGRPKAWLSYRAGVLGVRRALAGPALRWTDEEDGIVLKMTDDGRGATEIVRRLKRMGFKRTPGAVIARASTLGAALRREWWTASNVANMLGVDVGVILKRISGGYLVAKKEPGISSLADEGTFWRIEPAALRDFMLMYPNLWSHRSMQQHVLLMLLCPKEFDKAATKWGAG